MKKRYIQPQLTICDFSSMQPLCQLGGYNQSGDDTTLTHSRNDDAEDEAQQEEESPTWSNLW